MRHFTLLLTSTLLAASAHGQAVFRAAGSLNTSNIPGGSFDATEIIEAATGNNINSIRGVARIPTGNYIVCATRINDLTAHRLYEITPDGTFVSDYEAPSWTAVDFDGFRDLAWDGKTDGTSRVWGGMDGKGISAFDWNLGEFSGFATIANGSLRFYQGNQVDCLTFVDIGSDKVAVACEWFTPNVLDPDGSRINYNTVPSSFTYFSDVFEQYQPTLPDWQEVGDTSKRGAAWDPATQTIWWHVDRRNNNPNPNAARTTFVETDVQCNPTGKILANHFDVGVGPQTLPLGCEIYEDGDGNAVMVYAVSGAPGDDAQNDRVVEIYSRFTYGDGCNGSIGYNTEAYIGNTAWEITVDDVNAPLGGVLWRGTPSFLPGVALAPFVNPTCDLHVNLTGFVTVNPAAAPGPSLSWGLSIPNDGALIGAEAAFQALIPTLPAALPLDLTDAGYISVTSNL